MTESASVTADWTILEIEGVQKVAEDAVRKIAADRPVIEYDEEDLLQEAYILLATKANLRAAAEAGKLDLLHFRLTQDLVNIVETPLRRARLNTSYEALRIGAGE